MGHLQLQKFIYPWYANGLVIAAFSFSRLPQHSFTHAGLCNTAMIFSCRDVQTFYMADCRSGIELYLTLQACSLCYTIE